MHSFEVMLCFSSLQNIRGKAHCVRVGVCQFHDSLHVAANASDKIKNNMNINTCNRRKAAAADAVTNGRPAVVTVG